MAKSNSNKNGSGNDPSADKGAGSNPAGTTVAQQGDSKTYNHVLDIKKRISQEIKALKQRLSTEEADKTAAQNKLSLLENELSQAKNLLSDMETIYQDSEASRVQLVLIFIWSRFLEDADFTGKKNGLKEEFIEQLRKLEHHVKRDNAHDQKILREKYSLSPILNFSLFFDFVKHHTEAKTFLEKELAPQSIPARRADFIRLMEATAIQFPRKLEKIREKYALGTLEQAIRFSDEANNLWNTLRREVEKAENRHLNTGLDDCEHHYKKGIKDVIDTSVELGASVTTAEEFKAFMDKQGEEIKENSEADFYPIPPAVNDAITVALQDGTNALPITQTAVEDMLAILPALFEAKEHVEGIKYYSIGCILMVSMVLLESKANLDAVNSRVNSLTKAVADAQDEFDTLTAMVDLYQSLLTSTQASEQAAATALGQVLG